VRQRNDGGSSAARQMSRVRTPAEVPADIVERVSALCLALHEVTVRVDGSLTGTRSTAHSFDIRRRSFCLLVAWEGPTSNTVPLLVLRAGPYEREALLPLGHLFYASRAGHRPRLRSGTSSKGLHSELDAGVRTTRGYTVEKAVTDWLAEGLLGRTAKTVDVSRDAVQPQFPAPDRARAYDASDARIRTADLVAAVTNPVHQPGQNDHKQCREHLTASPSPPDTPPCDSSSCSLTVTLLC
jgi:hypothetical protein